MCKPHTMDGLVTVDLIEDSEEATLHQRIYNCAIYMECGCRKNTPVWERFGQCQRLLCCKHGTIMG